MELKKRIIKDLRNRVEHELSTVKAQYEETQKFKKSDDAKQESKYDTRLTEANYLSDGQKMRMSELAEELKLIDEIPVRSFKENDEVDIGALLEIEINQTSKKYFISTTAGGTMLNFGGEIILVISVFSPIGAEAMHLKQGDHFEVETKSGTRSYVIKSVY